MAKIIIIAPDGVDVKDAVKLLKGDGHDVDIEEPTPKSLLHIVLGLLGPNAYGFGASYSVGSAAVPPSEKEDDLPPEEEPPPEEEEEVDLSADEDDFHFEAKELDQVTVDGEVIKAVSHGAEHSVLMVTNLTPGPKVTYSLNESVFSFWPVDVDKPMQRVVDVGRREWCTPVELEVQLGEKQELRVGKALLAVLEAQNTSA